MTREEMEKKIAEMEAGIEELKEELKKTEDINLDVFIPKHGEKYLTVNSVGDICLSYWNDKEIIENRMDKNRLAIGNVFRTKEEAEFEIERLKVIYELRQYAEPRDIKLDGTKSHFSMIYAFNHDKIIVTSSSWWKSHDIYFSSKDKVWEAIKAVGEERVKKYYLCVEEGNI